MIERKNENNSDFGKVVYFDGSRKKQEQSESEETIANLGRNLTGVSRIVRWGDDDPCLGRPPRIIWD